jgi:capsular polysaccharide biosynthesis protein
VATAQSIPLTLRVEETDVLPQVSTAEELRDRAGSCFCELMPHSALTASELFPGHVAIRTGERDKPDWWSDDDSNVAALHLFKLRDVFWFPSFGVVVTATGEVMRLPMEDAAYLSPDLTALPGVAVVSGGSTVFTVPEGVGQLGRVALTMALGGNVNYGHFVLDCLPAAASIVKTGVLGDFVFGFPPLKLWQRRHLELLGIAPSEFGGDVYRVGEIVYTTGMHHYLHTPNLNYQDVRERQLAALGRTVDRGPRRLYLSRANYPNRTMASEDELRRRLLRLGFTRVDPATMSVDEQIALFRGAEVVVGSAGAAFANVLYCNPGTLIIEIQPAGMENQWVRNICLQNRCDFVAYFCNVIDGDPLRPEINLRYDIDVDRFMRTIAAFPPLDKPPPAIGWYEALSGVLRSLRGS